MKPIDLLDLLTRVNAAAQTPGEEHADLAEQFAQVMADPATADALAELRAQAEALAAERTSSPGTTTGTPSGWLNITRICCASCRTAR